MSVSSVKAGVPLNWTLLWAHLKGFVDLLRTGHPSATYLSGFVHFWEVCLEGHVKPGEKKDFGEDMKAVFKEFGQVQEDDALASSVSWSGWQSRRLPWKWTGCRRGNSTASRWAEAARIGPAVSFSLCTCQPERTCARSCLSYGFPDLKQVAGNEP